MAILRFSMLLKLFCWKLASIIINLLINYCQLKLVTSLTRLLNSRTQAARHTYNSRNRGSNKPLRFFSKSKIGEKSIQYRGTQIWNAIPLEIKNCELFTKFKMSYKNHLLENEVDSTIFLNQTDLLLFSWLGLSIQPIPWLSLTLLSVSSHQLSWLNK